MSVATLADLLPRALGQGHAVAGLVCLAWEDAQAFVAAAEAEALPVILQAGPGARAHMPLEIWGAMLRRLAETAAVPVVAHLDHGASLEECRAGIEAGFSSVMYDGSLDPLEQNIADTAAVAAMAQAAGASCEGELGVVGYQGGAPSAGTDPGEAARFAAETGVDALAISVGNRHLQDRPRARIDRARLDAIAAGCATPLVLHGGSGIPAATRRALARETAICKINIGTELRQTYGRSLRQLLAAQPGLYDRIAIARAQAPKLEAAARRCLRDLHPADPAESA